MKLHIIGSGSSGNSYLLQAENGETLMLECGVSFKKVKEALQFNLRCVVGSLVTHSHLDHCGAAKDVCAAGINVYCLKETSDAFKFTHHRINNFKPKEEFNLGAFKIFPFPVAHDVKCVGFLIYHPECGKVLFLTDTYYVKSVFKGLNNIIIEANYGDEQLDENEQSGKIQSWRSDRLIQSHMSIDTCLGVLKANDLNKVYQIVLVHLSDSNSNAEEFKARVEHATHKTVHIAKKGMVLDFNKTPF